MRAIVFTEYGSPDVLQLKEVPTPTPKDDEVLIKVHASSINSWDWEFQSGTSFINRLLYGLLKPKTTKQTLGADVAGTVETVGRDVTRFQPGDEVFGDLWDNWGGFAEYACARESALEPKPANSTFEQAAAVPQAGVLALQGLRKTGQIQPGQKVLINGAGGGVGTFAVQIAKLTGTEVTGVDYPHKLEVIRAVGADHVIDCTQEDFTRNGQQYDLILDVHGFRSMFDYKRALSPTGTYAMVGGTVPRMFQALLLRLWAALARESKKIRLVAEGPNKGLADLRELIEAGKVVPIVDRTYQLSEVPEAFRYFGEGRHKGKVVITMET
jgi:NADPH:quinone reductase-like Zn-dependent oxidoreductase